MGSNHLRREIGNRIIPRRFYNFRPLVRDYQNKIKLMDNYPELAGDSEDDFKKAIDMSDKADVIAEANSEEAEAFEPETI